MQITKIQVLIFTGYVMFTGQAFADDMQKGYFLKPYLGLSILGDSDAKINNQPGTNGSYDFKQDTGYVGGLAFGYQYNKNLMVEVAWEYRSNDTKIRNQPVGVSLNGDNSASNVVLVNGYYTFDHVSNFEPYIGLGVGWLQELDVDTKNNGSEVSYSDSGLAYQFMAGIRYPIAKEWKADLQLRYLNVTSKKLDAESGMGEIKRFDYDPVSLQIGISYHF